MEGTQRTCPRYSHAFTATAFLLVGCSDTQHVGSRQFSVPAENLVHESSYPFFLPPSKEDGFIFILNPGVEPTKQRSVLVQDRATVCDGARGREAHVNSTICAPQDVEWTGRTWFRRGDETFWTFGPETPSGSPAPFVSCFKMEIPGHPGLCNATLAADGLALTIGLNADELPALEATYKQAVSALRAWER